MTPQTICSTGFFVLCCAALVHSLHAANASLPVGMQHGQFPYESFTPCSITGATVQYGTCQIPNSFTNSSVNLITVPSDRMFVLTAVTTYSSFCYVEVNGIPIDNALTNFRNTWTTPLKEGTAHFAVAPNASIDLVVSSPASSCTFYVEGYYAHS